MMHYSNDTFLFIYQKVGSVITVRLHPPHLVFAYGPKRLVAEHSRFRAIGIILMWSSLEPARQMATVGLILIIVSVSEEVSTIPMH